MAEITSEKSVNPLCYVNSTLVLSPDKGGGNVYSTIHNKKTRDWGKWEKNYGWTPSLVEITPTYYILPNHAAWSRGSKANVLGFHGVDRSNGVVTNKPLKNQKSCAGTG